MRQGDRGSEAYVIERGTLEVHLNEASPGSMVVARLGPGDWVGEISLILDEPRSATVVAVTDAQLRRVSKADLGHVFAEDPERTQELVKQLAQRVKMVNERLVGRP
jgi:CRP-like cAMP-binding protein